MASPWSKPHAHGPGDLGSWWFISRDCVQSFLLHCSYIIPGTRNCSALTCSLGFMQRWREYILAFGFLRSHLWCSLPPAQNSGEGNIMWGLAQVSTQNQVCVSSLPPSSWVTIWSSLRDKKLNIRTDCAFLSFVLCCVLILYLNLGFGNSKARNIILYFLVLQPIPFFR